MNLSTTIREDVPVPLYILEPLQHLLIFKIDDFFGSRKILSSPCVSFQNIVFVIEFSKRLNNLLVFNVSSLTFEPAGVVLELRVGVVKKSCVQTVANEEPILDESVDVPEEVVKLAAEVKALVELLVDKADPEKQRFKIVVFSQNFVGLFFFCHREAEESWGYEDSSLSHQVELQFRFIESISDLCVLHELGIYTFQVRLVFVVQVLKLIYYIDYVGRKVS